MEGTPRHPLDSTFDPAAGQESEPQDLGEALGLHGLLELPRQGPLDGVEGASPERRHRPVLPTRCDRDCSSVVPARSAGVYAPRVTPGPRRWLGLVGRSRKKRSIAATAPLADGVPSASAAV